MMRIARIVTPVILLLISALLMSVAPSAAHAEGEPPSFAAIATDCELLDPGTEEVDANGILRFEGLTLGGFIESENELLAGTSVVVISGEINTATGNGRVWVDATFYPSAYPGSSWVAPGEGPAAPPAPITHRGYGTGGLDGLRIQFRARPLLQGHPGTAPCAEPLNVLEFRGVILDTPR